MNDRENSGLTRLGQVVAATHAAVRPSDRHHEQVRQAIESALAAAPPQRQRRAWRVAIPALICSGAVAASVLVWWPAPPPRVSLQSSPPATVIPMSIDPVPGDHSALQSMVPSEQTWLDLAKEGRYAEAFAMARPRFAAICRDEPPDTLLLLGDTARLSGALRYARGVYNSVRRRAPGSAAAAAAAFSLGRLELDRGRDLSAAARWFRRYLREQPSGAFAREAHGHLMEALSSTGDHVSARVAAIDYLLQHGDGPHAATARAILARPAR